MIYIGNLILRTLVLYLNILIIRSISKLAKYFAIYKLVHPVYNLVTCI